MTGSIAAFTAMAIATRAIRTTHDTFEILAYRSIIGLVLVLALAAALGRLPRITARRLPGHGLRNVVHFTGQALWFWALTQIPLAQVFALEFTSPIWVILLSPLLLGERITAARAIAGAMGFVGVLIVARPDFNALNLGVLAAAGSALAFALTNILTKVLTRGESIVSILFWLTLMQLGLSLVAGLADGVMTLPTAATLPWLILIGGAGLVAHLCLTTALSLASAVVVMPIDFVRLPLIIAIGMVLFGEAFDPWVLLGGAVIFAANFFNIRAENRARAQQPPRHNPVTPRH
jgi:drug/metabolite transporter (DMT)-like permease